MLLEKPSAGKHVQVKVIEHIMNYGGQFGVIPSTSQGSPTKVGATKNIKSVEIHETTNE